MSSQTDLSPVGAAVARSLDMGKVTGSIPVLGTIFLPKNRLFVVARLVGYLRATARVPTVFLPRLRLE